MYVHRGWRGAAAPSNPGRRCGGSSRRLGPSVDAAVAGPLIGRRAGCVGHRTVARGRQPAPQVLRSASALRVTAADDRARIALAGQPEGWPASHTNELRRSAVAANPARRPVGHLEEHSAGGRRYHVSDVQRSVKPTIRESGDCPVPWRRVDPESSTAATSNRVRDHRDLLLNYRTDAADVLRPAPNQ